MAAMTEEELFQQAYSLYEGDTTNWGTSDAEYLAARRYSKAAIQMWENYDNTKWRELFTNNSASSASDVTTSITAGTYQYSCPANFRYPCSYVRTIKSTSSSYYQVIPPEDRPIYDDNAQLWVYFSGNIKDGFKINFNPELTLSTGDTLSYEYYKQATYLTATTSTTEMSNPFFIVHYILWRMYKNDGEDGRAREEFQLCQQLLEQMRVDNMEGVWNGPNPIPEDSGSVGGFGI
jgi:hypothetical protein